MTPKEKASELINKYDETLTYLESKAKAKQCALIAVDEILNLVCCMDGKEHWQEYYEQVKIEIQNL